VGADWKPTSPCFGSLHPLAANFLMGATVSVPLLKQTIARPVYPHSAPWLAAGLASRLSVKISYN